MTGALRFNDQAIQQTFFRYVESFEDRERHSEEAVRCMEAFDDFCSKHIIGDAMDKIKAYTMMTDAMVEFEEGGFIAGFKTAIGILLSEEWQGEAPQQEPRPPKALEHVLNRQAQNNTMKEEKTMLGAANVPQDVPEPDKYIDTTQIAKFLGRTNWKTVRTINRSLLPFLTESEKKGFVPAKIRDSHKKEQIIYKLTLDGCKKFLELCEKGQWRNYANFQAGAELLKQEMEKVWCGECERHLA